MVELAVRTKLILDTVDAFILTMERRSIGDCGWSTRSSSSGRRSPTVSRGSLKPSGSNVAAPGLDLAHALVEAHRDPNERGEGDGDGR